MHDTMAAETIGQEESRHAGSWSQDGVVIGRHLVQSGPPSLRVDGEIFKHRDAISGEGQDFLDEGWLEIGVVTAGLLRIVPGKEKATAFRAEVKAVAHVNDHRGRMGEAVKRFGRHKHAPQRLDRQIDPGQLRYLRRPSAGGVNQGARSNLSARCLDAAYAVA